MIKTFIHPDELAVVSKHSKFALSSAHQPVPISECCQNKDEQHLLKKLAILKRNPSDGFVKIETTGNCNTHQTCPGRRQKQGLHCAAG
ncbi:hypothetical protein RRG08_008167 [Elysia crispata]|uniref:Uncharacterized protein n=1 Tax=Elysia crispata TaxID=231223 RepID=A0AAE0Z629_9GAST|nr:hypothetical protein RRG08_008167 [Elysia crispata]